MTHERFRIVRRRFKGAPEVILRGLDLEDAQAWCQREDTSGESWMDTYELENPTDEQVAERVEKDAALLRACQTIDKLIGGA